MHRLSQQVERRTVVEAYATYDCGKKGKSMPEFATWDWSRADAIDEQLSRAGLKNGILGGYLVWSMIEVTIEDLRECAVEVSIFPRKPRSLGLLERAGELVGWKPNRETSWYEPILGGRPCGKAEPLVFRPAVIGESPARWYIEDGSGRAAALVSNETRLRRFEIVATGYLGIVPDSGSRFMSERFPQLLI